ncbi:uncharacterized protein LOC111883230 [Lactuca sativa]|uniref:uncharacterized protein LOC111883230 n=1 Tax=Lactuca sativa TaxID=4236 RepID=UPI000CD8BCC8|nr:uncharacterized protein LOC111883230 [Lactuca sativa]
MTARKEKPKTNIHKSAEEIIAKKRQMNARYKKNLQERKQVFKTIKGKNSVVTKISLWVDKNKIFPIVKKSSHGPKKAWVPKSLCILYVMRDEQYDSEWYIDSGCPCHMAGMREELREARSLKDGGRVKFGNNATGEIKGYEIITNGEFSIRNVAYVEGLQHNLISVSQLVVGGGIKFSFDDEGF